MQTTSCEIARVDHGARTAHRAQHVRAVALAPTEADARAALDALGAADVPADLLDGLTEDERRVALARVRRHQRGERRDVDALVDLLRQARRALDAAVTYLDALRPLAVAAPAMGSMDLADLSLDADLRAVAEQAVYLRERVDARVDRLREQVGELELLTNEADWAA